MLYFCFHGNHLHNLRLNVYLVVSLVINYVKMIISINIYCTILVLYIYCTILVLYIYCTILVLYVYCTILVLYIYCTILVLYIYCTQGARVAQWVRSLDIQAYRQYGMGSNTKYSSIITVYYLKQFTIGKLADLILKTIEKFSNKISNMEIFVTKRKF
jgi:hypothetical protein